MFNIICKTMTQGPIPDIVDNFGIIEHLKKKKKKKKKTHKKNHLTIYYCFKLYLYRERERNVLFNDALNTFYLRLYGVRHMVKDHCDSEKENTLPPHRLLLSINSKGSFICTIPQTG